MTSKSKANETTLRKGDNLPSRGRSNKNRVLDGIRQCSNAKLSNNATRDEAETAYFKHIAEKAFDPVDKDSGMMIKLLGDKAYSSMKPTLGCVEFDFNASAKPYDQASQVMAAASRGKIAPDIANIFISSIASMLKIEEVTTLRQEVDEIKAILKEKNNA